MANLHFDDVQNQDVGTNLEYAKEMLYFSLAHIHFSEWGVL